MGVGVRASPGFDQGRVDQGRVDQGFGQAFARPYQVPVCVLFRNLFVITRTIHTRAHSKLYKGTQQYTQGHAPVCVLMHDHAGSVVVVVHGWTQVHCHSTERAAL